MSVTFRDRLADYFRQRPNTWIDGTWLEHIAGRYAWRSRVSDCRVQLGMTIENRQRTGTKADGTKFTISEYRYVPQESGAAVRVEANGQTTFI